MSSAVISRLLWNNMEAMLLSVVMKCLLFDLFWRIMKCLLFNSTCTCDLSMFLWTVMNNSFAYEIFSMKRLIRVMEISGTCDMRMHKKFKQERSGNAPVKQMNRDEKEEKSSVDGMYR